MNGIKQFDNIMNGRTPDGSPRNSTTSPRSSSPFELMESSLKAITTSDASKAKGSSSEDDTGMTPDEIEDINKSIKNHKDKLKKDTASFKESIGNLRLTLKKGGGYRKRTRKNNKRKKTQKKRKTKKTKKTKKKSKRKN
jgi:hypothetical protein